MTAAATDFTGGANARKAIVARHVRLVQAVEDAIDAFGRLRADGHDIDSLPEPLNDARNALHRAHDHLMVTGPVVTGVEFLEIHGAKAGS